jgi:hypothetical protein
MLKLYVVLFAVGALGLGRAPDRATNSSPVTGIYSDMHVSATTGDLGGMEVFVLSSSRATFALVQMAEGAPSTPVLVPATVKDSTITFTLPESSALGGLGTFSGVVRIGHLRGRFTNDYVIDLPRGRSYWQ